MKLTVQSMIRNGLTKSNAEYIMSMSQKLGAVKSFQTRDEDDRNRNIRFLDVSLAINNIELYLETATHRKAKESFPQKKKALIKLKEFYEISK